MKYLLILLTITVSQLAFAQLQLNVDEFTYNDSTKSYELDLRQQDIPITISSNVKPIEINAKYFDDNFLNFVFLDQHGAHRLYGYYKDNDGTWKKDYFEVGMTLISGTSSSRITKADFLDHSTLIFSVEHSLLNRKKVVEHFIWRIREDGIYEFPLKRKVRSGYRFDSKNPKRPKYK
ncbi:MAG: hypothetical protein AAFV95_04860 [Bacteroidota bacterium]